MRYSHTLIAQGSVPEIDIAALRNLAAHCTACPLHLLATQTVFGESPKEKPDLMLVGEQPGSEEDLTGKPFIGPAGRKLNEAFEEVGLSRSDVYITNAVKHFKWTSKGSRRLHVKPNRLEIAACFPWLKAELEWCRPKILVCLGTTAAEAVLGHKVVLKEWRGRFFPTVWAEDTCVTVHPSFLLRIPDPQARQEAYNAFVLDLRLVVERMKIGSSACSQPLKKTTEAFHLYQST